MPPFQPKGDRPAFLQTYSEKDLALLVSLASRRSTIPSDEEARIRQFVREIIARFDFPVHPRVAAGLEANLLAVSKRLAPYQTVYSRFLDRVRPRHIVLGNASYMNRPALFPLLRERNIPVYEPQHGWIGPSHAAYNFGAAFSEPELKAYLPDALLTFGEYWSERVRHPAVKVAVGKAALDKAVKEAEHGAKSRDRVLLVSSIYRTEDLTHLALELRKRLDSDVSVVVRPHPSERARATTTFATMIGVDGIELDDEQDLYRSFARARSVIGHSSTVLFEALPFGIPTFVIDSPLADLYTPKDVFGERLSIDKQAVDDIVQASMHPGARKAQIDLARIWAPDAVHNFNAFLESADLGNA